MKPFEIQGIWWVRGQPEVKSFGTLTCNEEGDINLRLFGGFSKIEFGSRQFSTIFGITNYEKNGGLVTLLNCIITKQKFASHNPAPSQNIINENVSNECDIFAHRAYLGAHLNESDFKFNKISLRIAGLDSWADALTGYTESTASTFSTNWNYPKSIEGPIDGGTFIIGVGLNRNETRRERNFKERVGIVLNFEHGIPDDQVTNVVAKLQNLLTFATNRPNAVTSISVRTVSNSDEVEVIGPAIFSDDTIKFDSRSMLFTLNHIADASMLFEKWLLLEKKYSLAFSVYFSNVYRPPAYSDLKVLNIAQVLSMYWSIRRQNQNNNQQLPVSTSAADSVLFGFSSAEMDSANPILNTGNALTSLFQELDSVIAPIAKSDKSNDSSRFISYILNTLFNIITGSVHKVPFTSDGAKLHWLSERLQLIFKIAILNELLGSQEQTFKIISANADYRHLISIAA